MIEFSVKDSLCFRAAVHDIEQISKEIEPVMRFWTRYYYCFRKKCHFFHDVYNGSIALEKEPLDFRQDCAAEIEDVLAERK